MERSRAWVEVDIEAVRANLNAIRKKVFPAGVLACVKADAYGLGAARIAPALEDLVDLFGVATVSEGVRLRQAGVSAKVLVLGLTLGPEIGGALENGLALTVADRPAARSVSLAARKLKKTASIHLKVDTGMGRIGLAPSELVGFDRWCRGLSGVVVSGVFTHFPAAETRNGFTLRQIREFDRVTSYLRPLPGKAAADGKVLRHAANSAGIFNYPESYLDLVRPGLALYGALPFQPAGSPFESFLKPVVTFAGRIVFLKEIPAGASVSYGRTFRAKRPTRVATISAGYADGYDRSLSNKAGVLVSGVRCPVVGTVCMDMMLADVSKVPSVRIGDTAVLIGRQGKGEIRVEEVAAWAGTVPHETLSRIGPRPERRYKE